MKKTRRNDRPTRDEINGYLLAPLGRGPPRKESTARTTAMMDAMAPTKPAISYSLKMRNGNWPVTCSTSRAAAEAPRNTAVGITMAQSMTLCTHASAIMSFLSRRRGVRLRWSGSDAGVSTTSMFVFLLPVMPTWGPAVVPAQPHRDCQQGQHPDDWMYGRQSEHARVARPRQEVGMHERRVQSLSPARHLPPENHERGDGKHEKHHVLDDPRKPWPAMY
jgi:hypothetical protein